MMFAFSVKNRSVYRHSSALAAASAIVIGMDVRRVLNTLLYAASDFPAPTRCPVIIWVDIAAAFENIIAKAISELQYDLAFTESFPIAFTNDRSVV